MPRSVMAVSLPAYLQLCFCVLLMKKRMISKCMLKILLKKVINKKPLEFLQGSKQKLYIKVSTLVTLLGRLRLWQNQSLKIYARFEIQNPLT